MSNYLKKMFAGAVLLVCLFAGNLKAYAETNYNVATIAESIQQLNDNQYIIPLYLTNNEGIMGFRLYLGYDSEILQIDSITNGIVTEKGTFATDIGSGENSYGSSVLWNTTENVTMDGSLCYMVVTVKNKNVEKITIGIGYSSEDTFDEQWRDVKLNCCDIVMKMPAEQEAALTDSDLESVSPELQKEIRDCVDTQKEIPFVEQIKSTVEKEEQTKQIGQDAIKRSLIRTLRDHNIKSISEIREEDEERFWSDVEDNMVKYEGVKKEDLKDMDVRPAAEEIGITDEEYYGDLEDTAVPAVEEEHAQKSGMVPCIAAVCGLAAVTAGLFLWMRRQRKGGI